MIYIVGAYSWSDNIILRAFPTFGEAEVYVQAYIFPTLEKEYAEVLSVNLKDEELEDIAKYQKLTAYTEANPTSLMARLGSLVFMLNGFYIEEVPSEAQESLQAYYRHTTYELPANIINDD